MDFDCSGNVSVITPSNLTEHNLNTAIMYTCDADYLTLVELMLQLVMRRENSTRGL